MPSPWELRRYTWTMAPPPPSPSQPSSNHSSRIRSAPFLIPLQPLPTLISTPTPTHTLIFLATLSQVMRLVLAPGRMSRGALYETLNLCITPSNPNPNSSTTPHPPSSSVSSYEVESGSDSQLRSLIRLAVQSLSSTTSSSFNPTHPPPVLSSSSSTPTLQPWATFLRVFHESWARLHPPLTLTLLGTLNGGAGTAAGGGEGKGEGKGEGEGEGLVGVGVGRGGGVLTLLRPSKQGGAESSWSFPHRPPHTPPPPPLPLPPPNQPPTRSSEEGLHGGFIATRR